MDRPFGRHEITGEGWRMGKSRGQADRSGTPLGRRESILERFLLAELFF
jgi:hypothetical protein